MARGMIFIAMLLIVSVGCSASPDATPWRTLDGEEPVVIAHRGDSGNYPEHTLAGYQSALDKGADLIEPDIVLTRDGVPICRHDLELGQTTDVASRPAFADRMDRGWQAAEFTLEEVRHLRAVQQVKGRDRSMDGRYAVPTLAELIDLVHEHNEAHGTRAGLLVEIKSPAKHLVLGLDVSRASYDIIRAKADEGKRVPIIFQCFDREACERIAGWGGYRVDWLTSQAFRFDELPKGIGGLGLSKSLIEIKDGRSPQIDAAHAMGLSVHAWTFRNDRLPDGADFEQPDLEMVPYLRAGLDGLITDFPATAISARRLTLEELQSRQGKAADEKRWRRIRDNRPRRLIPTH